MDSQKLSCPKDDVLVVQLTGRMHFGAARGLHANGRLAALVTDFRVPPLLHFPARFNLTLRHYCVDLPNEKVHGNPLVGLKYRRDIKRLEIYSAQPHIIASQKLASQAKKLARSMDFSTIYSFDIQALETFSSFKGQGKRFVLEQCVAPRRTLIELMDRLAGNLTEDPNSYHRSQLKVLADREEAEWKFADIIVCPSPYVKSELLRYGVADEKVKIVPYGFTPRAHTVNETVLRPKKRPLRALFVGSVEPRKGPQDLVTAVKRLEGAVQLDMFGNLSKVNPKDYKSPHVVLHGKLPFPRIEQAYREADVFVLPSYLEGSATVVYEAMSNGLPCIVTHETGSVIRDGVDGFIVPSGDIDTLTDRLRRLSNDPALCSKMGQAALSRSADFTLAKYGDRLCSALKL